MERMNNIDMLTETLEICEQGSYTVNGKQVTLKLSPEEMRQVQVYLPEEIERLEPGAGLLASVDGACCRYSCEKKDSFSAARAWCQNPAYQTECKYQKEGRNEILVLNFANPVNPGGGVRLGARAQEEDLCRKSSLLLSLETRQASRYYNYNRGLSARFMSSDAVMITPKVEIIRDENGDLLDETVVVSVMTCAAPYLRYGLDGMTQQQYEDLFYRRIVSMLRCASHMGYKYLVLGAFGCGAFGNDARVVADLFCKAFRQPVFENGRKGYNLFHTVDFAVLSRDPEEYNYKEFYRNFGDGNFYREEDEACKKMIE